MGINSLALYQCLLQDIEAYWQVPATPYSKEKRVAGSHTCRSGINPVCDFYDLDNIQAAASRSILSSFYKKLKDDPEPDFEESALRKFISLNERMKCFDVCINTSLDEILFNGFVNRYNDFFFRAMDSNRTWWTLDECFHHGRPGPGASLKANGSDFYTKLFSSPLSLTSDALYRHYVDALTSVPVLADRKSVV